MYNNPMTNESQETYTIPNVEHLHFSFHDFVQMQNYAKFWSYFDLYRFGNKPFFGKYDIFHHKSFQIANALYNDGLMYRGYSPKGTITLALMIEKEGSLSANRKLLNPGEIIIIDDSQPYEIAFSHSLHKGVISLTKEFVDKHAPFLYQMINKVYSDTNDRFKNIILNVEKNTLPKDYDIESDLISSLYSFSKENQQGIPKRLSKKESLIFDIRDLILKETGESLIIVDLSSTFNMSERTMQTAFKKIFGITPKKFIKRIKLNLAHQDIVKNNKGTTIAEVAIEYDFNNFGLFAREYKEVYGMLPSETKLLEDEKIKY